MHLLLLFIMSPTVNICAMVRGAGACWLDLLASLTLLFNGAQPEEYEKLGSYAMIGLPTELYEQR